VVDRDVAFTNDLFVGETIGLEGIGEFLHHSHLERNNSVLEVKKKVGLSSIFSLTLWVAFVNLGFGENRVV
jgi:hypothetical protein